MAGWETSLSTVSKRMINSESRGSRQGFDLLGRTLWHVALRFRVARWLGAHYSLRCRVFHNVLGATSDYGLTADGGYLLHGCRSFASRVSCGTTLVTSTRSETLESILIKRGLPDMNCRHMAPLIASTGGLSSVITGSGEACCRTLLGGARKIRARVLRLAAL